MAKDLTTSAIDRQNILNNPFAVKTIQENLDIQFLNFNGTLVTTKQKTAEFFGVELRTLERILKANEQELSFNGYRVLQGNELKEFKLCFGSDINVATKTTVLGVFDFRSFLNIGMLLTTSERAKELRAMMLDVVIAVMNEKAGGSTKYINRRDRNYVGSALIEEDYHKKLTDAIKDYVDGHKTYKYSQIMDMIYKAVFCEKAAEYKKLLDLSEKDNLRRTLYAEVLTAVSAFENATAEAIKSKAAELGVLTVKEVQEIIKEVAANPFGKPVVEDARIKMASRDNALRDVYHGNLAAYIRAVMPEEYHKFISNLSVDFDKLLDENKDVLEHLKQ
ncbi:MAG: DNA-binding protein [Bacteroidaceae bacterium]|nr:DNA-binding protein [Bacteroidaceae bacterium]